MKVCLQVEAHRILTAAGTDPAEERRSQLAVVVRNPAEVRHNLPAVAADILAVVHHTLLVGEDVNNHRVGDSLADFALEVGSNRSLDFEDKVIDLEQDMDVAVEEDLIFMSMAAKTRRSDKRVAYYSGIVESHRARLLVDSTTSSSVRGQLRVPEAELVTQEAITVIYQ